MSMHIVKVETIKIFFTNLKINLRNIPFKESFAGHTAEYKVNALTLESALKTAAILKRSFFFGRILP